MKKLKILTITLALTICAVLCVLPANAALIGGDGGFYYNLKSDNTATLEEYHGSDEDVVIPSDIYSYAVAAIAENTFSNNTTIRSVVIPDSVTTVGAYAFYGCSSFQSATIPSSVTVIKAATFYGDENLTEVLIPASVTQIAANAFNGCDNLTIKGETGSYAETYADEHGIYFESTGEPEPPITPISGDIDSDGNVTSADALSVLRMSASLEEYAPDIIPLADVDGDASITSADALEILRFSASLTANERIGQPV